MAGVDPGSGTGLRRGFVGRVHELSELVASLDEAITGRGSISLIVGQPGIGKTRLLGELAVAASKRGAQVAWGRCWEGHAPAYQPWRDIFRSIADPVEADAVLHRNREVIGYLAQLIPELRLEDTDPPPIESDLARFRLFEAMWQMLRTAAKDRPLVLLFDDLHWSDVTSVRVLEYVSRNLLDVPILVLGAYRDADVREQVELGEALAAVMRHGRSIPLRGLSEDEIALFVTETLDADVPVDVKARLHVLTGGNPFFVDELVRLLVAEARIDPSRRLPIPHGVREVIHRRLAPLDDETLTILRVAAVTGRTFDLGMVAEATSRTRDVVRSALWDACRLELLEETEPAMGTYTFVHELVKETLYEELPTAERMRTHLMVGQALERVRPAHHHPAEIARHYFEAAEEADRCETIQRLRRAGDHAMDLLAYEEAVLWFERAVAVGDLVDDHDETRRYELLCALGEANRRATRFEPSMIAFAKAAGLVREHPDQGAKFARAAIGFEDARNAAPDLWRLPESAVLLRCALDAVGTSDSLVRAQLQARLARVLHFLAPDEGQSMARDALEIAEHHGDVRLRAAALEGLRWAIWLPDALSERVAVASDWLATAQQAGDEEGALRARIALAIDFLESGQIGAVDAQIAAFEREAGAVRQEWFNWWPGAFRASKALMDGAFDEADRHLECVRTAGDNGHPLALGTAAFVDAQISWERGDPDALEATLERVIPHLPMPGFRQATSLIEATARGDRERARVFLDEFVAVVPVIPRALIRLPLLGVTCPGIAFVGDRASAQMIYEEIAPYEGRPLCQAPLPCFYSTSHWLGVLATVLERTDDAVRHFEDSLALCERVRAPAWAARTRLEYGRLLLESDTERGRTMLREALEAAERMGAHAIAQQAREALQERVEATAEVFRCEGEAWTLAFGGKAVRLQDTKGLRYVRELLARPGDEIHVLRLMSLADGNGNGSSTQGVRKRIDELRDEVDEATSLGDDVRATKASIELDGFVAEHARVMGVPAERARVNVTRSIARAIGRIRDAHPALGEHLQSFVRTGSFCVYAADASRAIHWST